MCLAVGQMNDVKLKWPATTTHTVFKVESLESSQRIIIPHVSLKASLQIKHPSQSLSDFRSRFVGYKVTHLGYGDAPSTLGSATRQQKIWQMESVSVVHTVDGRNPAPVDMYNIPLFIGFHTSQVVQDFVHQQYEPSTLTGMISPGPSLAPYSGSNLERAVDFFFRWHFFLATLLDTPQAKSGDGWKRPVGFWR